MLTTRNKQANKVVNALRAESKISGLIRFAATQLAVVGCVAMTLPAAAADITTSYQNPFRSCAGRLESIGISAEAAAPACAEALNPIDLSRCVARIEQQTDITAVDALGTCSQTRRPIDVSRCVVGISDNSQEQPVPGILSYCGRSLLPVTYAECVVGLQREVEIATTQALETCISASDRPNEFAPTFIPQSQLELLQPGLPPTIPETPPAQPAPAPTTP